MARLARSSTLRAHLAIPSFLTTVKTRSPWTPWRHRHNHNIPFHPQIQPMYRGVEAYTPALTAPPTFKRVIVPQTPYVPLVAADANGVKPQYPGNVVSIADGINCVACRSFHPVGRCPLKMAGVEYCNLCGMAHFGSARVCPHIQSETQVSASPAL